MMVTTGNLAKAPTESGAWHTLLTLEKKRVGKECAQWNDEWTHSAKDVATQKHASNTKSAHRVRYKSYC